MPMLSSMCCRIGLSLTLLACLVVGCSGSGEPLPKLVNVTGVVTAKGKPLEKISVTFLPQSDDAASSGATDAEGKFTLMYNQHAKGAVIGQHRVTFQLSDADAMSNPIPKKYENVDSRPVVEVTAAGPNEFTFDLSE